MTGQNRQKIITFTGSLASGKSTVAKKLAQELSLPYFSGGSFQREWAEKQNKSVTEINADPKYNVWLDEKIDSRLQAIGWEKDPAPQIIDSRLGWHFIPNSLKIYLYTALDISAERKLAQADQGEQYASLAQAKEKLGARREEERRRFKGKYGADFSDINNYDVFIDTSFMEPGQVYDLVKSCAARYLRGERVESEHWISPSQAVPLEYVPAKIRDVLEICGKTSDPGKHFHDKPRVVLYRDNYYISDGHKRTLAALLNDVRVWPVQIYRDDDKLPGTGISARQERIDSYKPSHYYDWQDIVNHYRQEAGSPAIDWQKAGKNVPLKPFSSDSDGPALSNYPAP